MAKAGKGCDRLEIPIDSISKLIQQDDIVLSLCKVKISENEIDSVFPTRIYSYHTSPNACLFLILQSKLCSPLYIFQFDLVIIGFYWIQRYIQLRLFSLFAKKGNITSGFDGLPPASLLIVSFSREFLCELTTCTSCVYVICWQRNCVYALSASR